MFGFFYYSLRKYGISLQIAIYMLLMASVLLSSFLIFLACCTSYGGMYMDYSINEVVSASNPSSNRIEVNSTDLLINLPSNRTEVNSTDLLINLPSIGSEVNLTELSINETVLPSYGEKVNLTDLPINETVLPSYGEKVTLTDLPINETVLVPNNGTEANLTDPSLDKIPLSINNGTESQTKVAKSIDERIAWDEESNAKLHKPSEHKPLQEVLFLDEMHQASFKNLIRLELQKIRYTFVSWFFGPHRPYFPSDIKLSEISGNNSNKGGPPANVWLTPNQVLVAHRKPHARYSNYSISHWQELMAKSNARNIGLILVGDEHNFGSSFLNERLDNTSHFSFLIRDYYFEKLKNAEETLLVQLGSMTCKQKKLACSVAPPDIAFARLLTPGVGVKFRPSTFIKASQRSRKCFWAGSDRFDRNSMVAFFEQSGGCEVYMTSGFNEGLAKTTYADILANTAFGLVPRGNSFETHRLAEVLMFGAIPVMLDESANAPHMLSYAEPIPLIHGATWKEAEQRMIELSANDMDELQKRVITWWDNYWKCVHDDMRWIMAQAHAVSQGRNLCNESIGHYNDLKLILGLDTGLVGP